MYPLQKSGLNSYNYIRFADKYKHSDLKIMKKDLRNKHSISTGRTRRMSFYLSGYETGFSRKHKQQQIA